MKANANFDMQYLQLSQAFSTAKNKQQRRFEIDKELNQANNASVIFSQGQTLRDSLIDVDKTYSTIRIVQENEKMKEHV